jgi:hypothetical protein
LRKRNEGERGKSERREKEMRSREKEMRLKEIRVREGNQSFFFNCVNFVAALATGKSPAFFEFV